MSDASRSALREQGGLLAELAERRGPTGKLTRTRAGPPQPAASGPRRTGAKRSTSCCSR